jgi:hypothetical protein
MDLPVFALHTVLFPGQSLHLTVFEERYRLMMEEVLPESPFAVVAIRRGQEVGGPYDPYRVGVKVVPDDYELTDEETYELTVSATERLRLVRPVREHPYAVWSVERFPEEGTAGQAEVAVALAAARRFVAAAEIEALAELPEDPVLLSYALAALVPTLVPDHQALLELPGPADRLERVASALRTEAGLLRALKGRRQS